MQTANILLALGGDKGNTVPKYDVTPSEIAVLRAIHGDEAVTDIEPLPREKLSGEGQPITNRGELNRLRAIYGAAKNGENEAHFDLLFPGAGARAYQTLDELELPDVFFKASGRMAAAPAAAPAAKAPEGGLQGMTVAQLKALAAKNNIDLGDALKKSDIIDAIEAAAAETDEPAEAEPGEGDMLDAPAARPATGASLFT